MALLGEVLGEKERVLVVDADESNLGLAMMLGLEPPTKTLLDYLGGRPAVAPKLMAMIQSKGTEQVPLFAERFAMDNLPAECVRGDGAVSYLRIGKIEHTMEGCACPMGAVARAFLKQFEPGENGWVLVDTEAGVEHFGRGVLEGADSVLVVVDPSFEAVTLAEKAKRLAAEAGKGFFVVLNKVDDGTTSILRKVLWAKGVDEAAVAMEDPWS